MALISTNNIKSTVGAVTDFIFEVPDFQSVIIKDIYIEPQPNAYALIKIETTSRGYFRTASNGLGSHLPFLTPGNRGKTILQVLREKGIFNGYPVATGERFLIRNSVATRMAIVYDVYDRDEIKSTSENGSESKIYTTLLYGRPKSTTPVVGEIIVNAGTNPTDFPNFPFSETAPSGKKITLFGLIFSARSADDGTTASNYIVTNYLRVATGEKTLFDRDGNGFLALGKPVSSGGGFEVSNYLDVGGENSDVDPRQLLILDKVLLAEKNQELNTIWRVGTAATPGSFLPEELEIAYIAKIETL